MRSEPAAKPPDDRLSDIKKAREAAEAEEKRLLGKPIEPAPEPEPSVKKRSMEGFKARQTRTYDSERRNERERERREDMEREREYQRHDRERFDRKGWDTYEPGKDRGRDRSRDRYDGRDRRNRSRSRDHFRRETWKDRHRSRELQRDRSPRDRDNRDRPMDRDRGRDRDRDRDRPYRRPRRSPSVNPLAYQVKGVTEDEVERVIEENGKPYMIVEYEDRLRNGGTASEDEVRAFFKGFVVEKVMFSPEHGLVYVTFSSGEDTATRAMRVLSAGRMQLAYREIRLTIAEKGVFNGVLSCRILFFFF